MTALLWSVGSIGYVAMAVLIGGYRWGTYRHFGWAEKYRCCDCRETFLLDFPEAHKEGRAFSSLFFGLLWPAGGTMLLAAGYGDSVRAKREAIKAQEAEIAKFLGAP